MLQGRVNTSKHGCDSQLGLGSGPGVYFKIFSPVLFYFRSNGLRSIGVSPKIQTTLYQLNPTVDTDVGNC